jgi:hypothetical protein
MTYQTWKRFSGFGSQSPGVFIVPAVAEDEWPGWEAPAVSGLKAIWRADRGVATSGGNVTAVQDLIGSNDLAPSGTVALNATGFNSKPCFEFLNTGCLVGAFNMLSSSNTGSVFLMFRRSDPDPAFGGIVTYRGNGQTNDWDNQSSFAFSYNTDTTKMAVTRASTDTSPEVTLTLDTIYCLGIVWSGTTRKLYVDNVEAATIADTAIWNDANPGQIRIGARWSSNAETLYLHDADIPEVIVSQNAFDGTERTAVYTYLTSGPNGWNA